MAARRDREVGLLRPAARTACAAAVCAVSAARIALATAPVAPRHAPVADRIHPGFVETVLADSIDSPVSMAVAPDGRVFVCEQGGRLRVIKRDLLLARPFVTLSAVMPRVFDLQRCFLPSWTGLRAVVCQTKTRSQSVALGVVA